MLSVSQPLTGIAEFVTVKCEILYNRKTTLVKRQFTQSKWRFFRYVKLPDCPMDMLSRITIAFFRASFSAVILFAALAFRQPRSLRIAWRDVPFFLAFGLFGIAAFYVVYITAIDLAGMSVAAVLLYTAPAWVAMISAIFLGEPLTKRTTLAVALAMIGCALVARVYDLHGLQLNGLGILAGAGVCRVGRAARSGSTARRHTDSRRRDLTRARRPGMTKTGHLCRMAR